MFTNSLHANGSATVGAEIYVAAFDST